MSSIDTVFQIQGLVQTIYQNAQNPGNFNPAENEANIQRLGFLVRDMVSTARSESNLTLQRQASHALNRVAQRPVNSGPYTAPLRQASLPPRYNPTEKSKVVSQAKLEENCPEDCAICQEQPKVKDSICTECNHWYCKTCWNDWMNSSTGNKKCPTCRKDMPRVTAFKARATTKVSGPLSRPAVKSRPTLIIEDDPRPSLFDELDDDVTHMSASIDEFVPASRPTLNPTPTLNQTPSLFDELDDDVTHMSASIDDF